MGEIEKNQMSETFRLGAVLALAGGFLDAYTYLVRGKVFANAETGNMVLLGVNLLNGRWEQALGYLAPILAFALGVVVAEAIKACVQKKRALHWRQFCLLVELVILLIVAFLPQSMNSVANVAVAFVCAIQVDTFRKVHGNAFVTTMCTGNLRSGTERLWQFLHDGKREALGQAAQYYGIILCFIIGAALGSFGSGLWMEKAVLIPFVLLLAAFVMMFWKRETQGQTPEV